MQNNKFGKKEKLTSKIAISELFAEGNSFIAYPLRFIYRVSDQAETVESYDSSVYVKALISVSKRYFKRAVKRNLIKRRIREAYRLNDREFNDCLIELNKSIELGVLYVGKEVESYSVFEKKLKIGLSRIIKELEKKQNETHA